MTVPLTLSLVSILEDAGCVTAARLVREGVGPQDVLDARLEVDPEHYDDPEWGILEAWQAGRARAAEWGDTE